MSSVSEQFSGWIVALMDRCKTFCNKNVNVLIRRGYDFYPKFKKQVCKTGHILSLLLDLTTVCAGTSLCTVQ